MQVLNKFKTGLKLAHGTKDLTETLAVSGKAETIRCSVIGYKRVIEMLNAALIWFRQVGIKVQNFLSLFCLHRSSNFCTKN